SCTTASPTGSTPSGPPTSRRADPRNRPRVGSRRRAWPIMVSVTRIISGEAGGRRLSTPGGERTRPTSDRVREALFSSLEARGVLEGAHVMDLYAGSGALGLEAASRGAASVLLVESDRGASATIRANISDVGVAGARLLSSTVERALDRPATLRYDVVLADPPYDVTE